MFFGGVVMKKISVFMVCFLAMMSCSIDQIQDLLSPPSSKEITSFNFTDPPATAVIDQVSNTINILIYSAQVSNRTALFAFTGQSVLIGTNVQLSGVTTNDFSSPLTYTVVGSDMSTRSYIVTVSNISSQTETSNGKQLASASQLGRSHAYAFQNKVYYVYSTNNTTAPVVGVYDAETDTNYQLGGVLPGSATQFGYNNHIFVKETNEVYVVAQSNANAVIYKYDGSSWNVYESLALNINSVNLDATYYNDNIYFSVKSTSGTYIGYQLWKYDLTLKSSAIIGGGVITNETVGYANSGLYVENENSIFVAYNDTTYANLYYWNGVLWDRLVTDSDGILTMNGQGWLNVSGYGNTAYLISSDNSAVKIHSLTSGGILNQVGTDMTPAVVGDPINIFLNVDAGGISYATAKGFLFKVKKLVSNSWVDSVSRTLAYNAWYGQQQTGVKLGNTMYYVSSINGSYGIRLLRQ